MALWLSFCCNVCLCVCVFVHLSASVCEWVHLCVSVYTTLLICVQMIVWGPLYCSDQHGHLTSKITNSHTWHCALTSALRCIPRHCSFHLLLSALLILMQRFKAFRLCPSFLPTASVLSPLRFFFSGVSACSVSHFDHCTHWCCGYLPWWAPAAETHPSHILHRSCRASCGQDWEKSGDGRGRPWLKEAARWEWHCYVTVSFTLSK